MGRSNLNNRIAKKLDYINDTEPYKKGDITLAFFGALFRFLFYSATRILYKSKCECIKS